MNSKQTETAQRAMAQDYWLQVMKPMDRLNVMQQCPRNGESELKWLRRLHLYVFQTNTKAVIAHQKQLLASIQ